MGKDMKLRKFIATTIREYLNDQYQFDESKLKKLIEIIKNKYPQINSGGCAVFAKAFHNVTGLPYMLIIDDGLPEEDPPIHVMIKLPNGKLIDGEGIQTKGSVIKYYKSLDVLDGFQDGASLEGKLLFLEDVDGSILENYYDELGSGLFSTCHKDDYDDILSIIKSVLGNF
jgi:hypothetical protein